MPIALPKNRQIEIYETFTFLYDAFLSVVLLQTSTAGLGPLEALSGFALGFAAQQIGLFNSVRFLDF